MGKGELSESMSAIDDGFDSPRARHFANTLHRENLAGSISDVADVDDLGLRRNGIFKYFHQIIHAGRRHGERELLKLDSVTALALLPGGDHAAVILIGGDHFIAGLQMHTELDNLVRFPAIAGNAHLFRSA